MEDSQQALSALCKSPNSYKDFYSLVPLRIKDASSCQALDSTLPHPLLNLHKSCIEIKVKLGRLCGFISKLLILLIADFGRLLIFFVAVLPGFLLGGGLFG